MTMRATLKNIVKRIFLIVTFPIFTVYWIIKCFSSTDQTFKGFSQLLSMIPGRPGIYIRATFYSLACPDTSDDISIGFLTIFSHRNTSISKGVYIGPQCNIGSCIIGANTLIGSGVHILSGSRQHNFSDPTKSIQEQNGEFIKIEIGMDCWLGNGSIVMAHVKDYSIVAAGTVVVKPIEESGSIVGGNPAKPIGKRPIKEPRI